MKKKWLWLGAIIIILIFLLISYSTYVKIPSPESNVIACPEYRSLINNASSQKDPNLCQQIPDQYCKDMCLALVSMSVYDVSICSQIVDNETRIRCFDRMAIQTQDVSICNSIQETEQKNECYRHVAAAKKDSSICNLISDKDNVSDIYFCLGVTPRNQTTPELCAKSSKFETCARESGGCEKITSSIIAKDICMIISGDSSSNESKYCEMLPYKTDEEIDACKNNNPPCTRLTSEEGKEFCTATLNVGYTLHSTSNISRYKYDNQLTAEI